MDITLFLADYAQADANNKVHAIGIGWTITTSPSPPHAVVALLGVPWDQTNREHTFSFVLTDQDGREVQGLPDADGNPTTVKVEGSFEVGRPVGLPPGRPIAVPLVINVVPGLQLEQRTSYDWTLVVDGSDEWRRVVSFLVQGQAVQPGGGGVPPR